MARSKSQPVASPEAGPAETRCGHWTLEQAPPGGDGRHRADAPPPLACTLCGERFLAATVRELPPATQAVRLDLTGPDDRARLVRRARGPHGVLVAPDGTEVSLEAAGRMLLSRLGPRLCPHRLLDIVEGLRVPTTGGRLWNKAVWRCPDCGLAFSTDRMSLVPRWTEVVRVGAGEDLRLFDVLPDRTLREQTAGAPPIRFASLVRLAETA